MDTKINKSFATLSPGAVKYPAAPWQRSAAEQMAIRKKPNKRYIFSNAVNR
jgi:hypothetical protein